MNKGEFTAGLLKGKNFFTQKNLKPRELDYRKYRFSLREAIIRVIAIMGILSAVSFLFYRSLWGMVLLAPVGIYIYRSMAETEADKIRKTLAMQFKDCIKSIARSMKAGYSVENAFRESLKDVNLVHGEGSVMSKEIEGIIKALGNNVTLEEELLSLGERSGVNDIREFGEIFKIAKRGGGNLTGIISDTVMLMDKKLETDEEIRVIISSKKMEGQIMEFVPFAIIAYISFTSPGFFESLYHNILGVIIMSICLGVYFGAVILSKRITDIEV